MRIPRALWLIFLLSLLLLSACAEDTADPGDGDVPDGDTPDGDVPDGDTPDGDVPDGDMPDGDTPDGDEPESIEPFHFVIISDTHTRLEGMPDADYYKPAVNQENLRLAVERINDEFADADFVAVTGDMVGCLYSEDPDDYGVGGTNPAETFKELTDPLIPPMFAILGNHDYQNDYDPVINEGITSDDFDAIEAVWKKVLGIDPYYSVVHKGVRLLFLNANRGDKKDVLCAMCTVEAVCTGSFDAEQLDWLEDELTNPEPIIVFVHHPPITDTRTSMFAFVPSFLIHEDDLFYEIIEPHADRVMGIFVGHGHIWERDTLFGTIPVYETGSIGDTNGHADNIHVVEVKAEGPALEVSIARDGADYWSDVMQ